MSKIDSDKNYEDINQKRSIGAGRIVWGLMKHAIVIIACFAALYLLAGCGGAGMGSDSLGTAKSGALHNEENLEVHFLDVGQADCALLISQGEAMLIDAGNRDDSNLVVEYLKQQEIDRLKYVVFTHPHEDHIGSGEAVVANFEIERIFMLDEYDDGIEGYLSATIEAAGVDTEMPEPGDVAEFGECVVEFLGPSHDFSDTNDDSVCLKVRHGERAFMFTGDAGSGPEREMIEAGFDLEADVFSAGHHGSSTSNSYYFLREMNPRYVVVSCGEGNMYGHPHEEAMSRFNDLGAEVFRTDEQGTVIAVSDGSEITFNVEGKKATRPYTEGSGGSGASGGSFGAAGDGASSSDAAFEGAVYVGNLNSKKYHAPTCGGLPADHNRVYFDSMKAAEKAGYDPCGRCLE